MTPPNANCKSLIYFRAVMVAVAIIYLATIFGGYKARNHKSFSYKLRSVDAVEFHHIPTGREFYSHAGGFYELATSVVPPTLHHPGQRIAKPGILTLVPQTYRIFHSLITINAP